MDVRSRFQHSVHVIGDTFFGSDVSPGLVGTRVVPRHLLPWHELRYLVTVTELLVQLMPHDMGVAITEKNA